MMPDEPPRFTLRTNDYGEAVLVHESGPPFLNLGPKDEACEIMADFLASIDFGEKC
jgi:hypothetical protein